MKKKSLSSGTRIGTYEILSPLGAGGMGEVFRARDLKLEREVAIKVLPAAFSNDPERLGRFEQEARAAAALNHPNILAIFHIGRYQGSQYMVSELIEGETLREHLRSGPIPLSSAVDYAIQGARGLAAVHEKRIIHRDLKPENILISKDGRVKILDFGLAKQTRPEEKVAQPGEQITASGTDYGTIMGSAGYMSPEQVRGRPVDHRSDIFSFGSVLYEMLSGRPPFATETSVETMTAILKEQPPAIAHRDGSIPPGLERIVWRCLEKNPDQRFQSAKDLVFNLEGFCSVPPAKTLFLAVQHYVGQLPRLISLVLLLAVFIGAFLATEQRRFTFSVSSVALLPNVGADHASVSGERVEFAPQLCDAVVTGNGRNRHIWKGIGSNSIFIETASDAFKGN